LIIYCRHASSTKNNNFLPCVRIFFLETLFFYG
jgi:hypothetical protein